MNRIVAIVAALPVLAHSVFGCCAHHCHGVTPYAANCDSLQCCDASAEPISEPHERHGCGHKRTGPGQNLEVAQAQADCALCESESSRHLPHQCSHGPCQWHVAKPYNASSLVALDHSLVVFSPTEAHSTFATATVCVSESELRQRLALPLRSHLALGVLQI